MLIPFFVIQPTKFVANDTFTRGRKRTLLLPVVALHEHVRVEATEQVSVSFYHFHRSDRLCLSFSKQHLSLLLFAR